MRITSPETGRDITPVAAILSVGVAISGESFPAAGAGESVDRLSLNLVRMRVPPFLAADGRAELHSFSALCLAQRSAALPAELLLRRDTGVAACFDTRQAMSAAVCLNAAFRKPYRLCDGRITVTFLPQRADALPLLYSHALPSVQRNSVLITHWNKEGRLDEENPPKIKSSTGHNPLFSYLKALSPTPSPSPNSALASP